ncbi:hypothetical protein ArsFIN_47580 (plasmid) [Arsenophonus nasoniae]|uniref:Transposase IS4-like domain-containing protein n=1 Tax=Arsenophonus nasoniae TaxID=638 RepID=A0A4P7L0E0_9GAMM|nr:hypothetical protein [Arsenophonus nasoniae]QBY46147.1 hypothetical protein ArsFIN_47580 [Arsenophonus nasoniae]
MLLSNVLEEIKCDELARCYYWRWTIKSFFKLIKSAGHNVEFWLQKIAKALLRRLIIASMACVLVWRIQRAEEIQNAKARRFLCRLSGRPQKRGRRESAPAIFAGLSVLLNTIQLLSEYSAEELSKFTSTILGSPKYV